MSYNTDSREPDTLHKTKKDIKYTKGRMERRRQKKEKEGDMMDQFDMLHASFQLLINYLM